MRRRVWVLFRALVPDTIFLVFELRRWRRGAWCSFGTILPHVENVGNVCGTLQALDMCILARWYCP